MKFWQVGRLEAWLRERRRLRMIREYGGIQTCPWCKQCAQDNNDRWHFRPYAPDPMYDVLTCGVCEGRSLWMFTIGMIYVRALDHPVERPHVQRVASFLLTTNPG